MWHDGWHAALTAAGETHGVISAERLRRCGISAGRQRRATLDGRLRRVRAGIYVVAGAPDTWHQRLQIGLMSLGGHSWVSHEAAAALHELDRHRPGSIEFAVARGRHNGCDIGARVHRTRDLRPSDIVTVDGLRCSSATRTILELANAGVGPRRLGAMLDSTVRLRLSAPVVLAERLATHRTRGRSGVRLVDHLLVDSGGESVLERDFLTLCRRAGIPRPATQRRIHDGSRLVGRVDFVFPEPRLVVEVSGGLGHSSPTDRAKDAQRRNELQDLGYTVIEYTSRDIADRPTYVASSLRTRLTA